MDIMEYLLLEISNVLFLNSTIEEAGTVEEVNKINETISLMETQMLEWCSLDNFLEARGYYTEMLLNKNLTNLFGIAILDLIDYAETLILKKMERGL